MLPHTVLQPVDSIESVHVIVQRLMAERGDAVVDMSRCTFYLRQPGATKKDDVHLDDIHRPIATWKPAQGSILVVKGRLKSASDQKKVCFSRAPFEEGVSACDYFTCQECKLNWICEACAEGCHRSRGHTLVPYLQAHTASWACCYCRKAKGQKCALR
mmetsp:Transcript_8311/g.20946  ORF Transcript_8311/g.20946 Transcript_8311/m.20946 type:complete len:158 (+) Transcript_8311:1058-1531(+)